MPSTPAGQQLGTEISREVAAAFIYLEAVDRAALAAMSPALTTAQFHALVALDALPEQSLGELAARLLCDKANASGIVDRLESLGLVSRVRTPADRRRVSLTVMPAGRKALEEAIDRREAGLTAALAGIPAEELTAIRDTLARLRCVLETAHRGPNTKEQGARSERSG